MNKRKNSFAIIITCIAAVLLILVFIFIRMFFFGGTSSGKAKSESATVSRQDAETENAGQTVLVGEADVIDELTGESESTSESKEADTSSSAESGSDESAPDGASAFINPETGKHWNSPLERYFYDEDFFKGCPKRNIQLLTPNEYSRPQTPIDEVNDIVIHYVDQPGSTAMDNRNYFESLKTGEEGRSASSHFIISTDGEIVQCVPLGEVAYASNHRNHDTISIECCHPDDTGEFTKSTYKACIDLTAWLCYAFEISPDHVIRHYDVTGKDCPIYYVRHPDKWADLKADVSKRYDKYVKKYGYG